MVSISEKGSPVLAGPDSAVSPDLDHDGGDVIDQSPAEEPAIRTKSNAVKRLFSKSQAEDAVSGSTRRVARLPSRVVSRDVEESSQRDASRRSGPLDGPPPVFRLKAAKDKMEAQMIASLQEDVQNGDLVSRQARQGHRFSIRARETDMSAVSSDDPMVSKELHKIFKVTLICAC